MESLYNFSLTDVILNVSRAYVCIFAVETVIELIKPRSTYSYRLYRKVKRYLHMLPYGRNRFVSNNVNFLQLYGVGVDIFMDFGIYWIIICGLLKNWTIIGLFLRMVMIVIMCWQLFYMYLMYALSTFKYPS